MSNNALSGDVAFNCYLCGKPCNKKFYTEIDTFHYLCLFCGEVRINESFCITVTTIDNSKSVKQNLSYYFRTRKENKLEPETVGLNNYQELISSIYIPSNLSDKLNFAVQIIGNRSKHFGAETVFRKEFDYFLFFCENVIELKYLLLTLSERKYIRISNHGGETNIWLTDEGWILFESEKNKSKSSTQAFIAMSFSDKLIEDISEVIQRAILKSGFTPRLIIDKEHNNDIVDEIIAEIRASKFVVVDFTEHRNSVYFEAGFAYGLGLPVIWMCRKDDFESGKTAFDTNHFNHVVWDKPIDLEMKLYNRIKATII